MTLTGTVRTECDTCGPIILSPRETAVGVHVNNYSFKCPKCGKITVRKVGLHIVKALLATGSSVGPRGPIAAG